MEIDNWIWLLGAFWLGALVGFGACAMVQAGHQADARRARRVRAIHPDLLADTITRF